MERIQNILQRLQELYYSKHTKSSIDLDLMLDYTRVLYADLLEWKKNVPAVANEVITAPHKEDHPKAETQDDNTKQDEAKEETPDVTELNKSTDEESTADNSADAQDLTEEEPAETHKYTENEGEASVEEEQEENTPPEQEESAIEIPIAAYVNEEASVAEKEYKEIKHEDIYSDIVEEFPEKESMNAIKDDNGISFELPSEAASISYTEDVTAVEEPVANAPVEVYELPTVPIDEQAHKPQQDLFTAVNSNNKKDIRTGIGINDKYLFLNELFNNHKTEYEEALDRLNRFNDYQEAYNWVVANTAVYNKWEEEDETVQNFFSVLKKHFSASK